MQSSELVRLEAQEKTVPSYSSVPPDVRLLVGDHGERKAHRIILARFSSLLHSVMAEMEDQEDLCIQIPDFSSQQVDRMLHLAYHGTISGLSRADISSITNICHLLHVKQEQFVVRAEDSVECDVTENEETFDSVEINTIDDQEDSPSPSQTNFIDEESPDSHVETSQRNQTSRKEERTGTGSKTGPVFKFEHYELREEQYYCTFPGCDYQEPFKTLGGCKNHQLRYHAREEEKRFACQFCDKKFASNQLRNKHQNLSHTKRYPCEVCQKMFSEKSRLLIHLRTHSGERPWVCEDCGFSCTQKDNLRIHREFKHPASGQQDKKFTCDICSASFLTSSNLKRHVLTHSDVRLCVCETCGKSFKDPGSLRQHTFSHGEREYVCKICSHKFTSPLYLSRHLSRLHPTDGVQPLTCGQCGKGFPLRHQLEDHIEAVHEQKKHRCPQCNLLIGRRSSVARHIKKGRCRAFPVLVPDSVSTLV